MIFALNFFASVKIAEALRPLLKKKRQLCGNLLQLHHQHDAVRMDWVDMLSNVMDEERILEFVKDIPRTQAASCYSSSKHALARWVRRVSPSWAVDGLRINSVAPGNTTTPMTQNMTDAPDGIRAADSHSYPLWTQGIP
ncbi:MAG: SDR family NAD(P)-dependent oxidoreductase [Acutalibacteraceae bacterium]